MLGKGFVGGKGSNAKVGFKGRALRERPAESRTEPALKAHRFSFAPPKSSSRLFEAVRGSACAKGWEKNRSSPRRGATSPWSP